MFRGFKVLAGAAAMLMAAVAVVPSTAEATAYASSSLEVDEALFSGAGFTGFSSFFFRLNQISATVNGVTTSSPGTLTSLTGGSSLDQPVVKQNGGSCVSLASCGTFVNNDFFPSQGPLAVGGNYAVADSHELNTAISAGTGLWGSLAQAQLTGPVTATAQTGTDNTLQWNFTSPGGAVNFSADLTQNFHVLLDASGILAHATAGLRVLIQQGGATVATLYDLSTDAGAVGCRDTTITATANVHPCDDITRAISGSAVLTPGNYSLLIAFGTSADVVQGEPVRVPEPATLTLLGLGVIGAAYAVRRRR